MSAGTQSTSTVRITDDDDPAVAVSFGAATYDVAEGGSVTVEVRLSAVPERGVVIPITRSNRGGATDGDYSGVPLASAFDPGDESWTFTFSATQDSVDDDGESVELGFGAMLPPGVSVGTPRTSTVRITDDDDPEVPAAIVIKSPLEVSFERSSYSVGEGATLNVTLRLNAAHQGVLEVVIPVILDTSESASEADITAEESVTFAAGETRKTLSVRAIDDDLVEGSESAVLRLGTLPAGITAGTTTEGAVTITDPDRATISFTVPTLQVAEGGHAPLTFAITNGVTFQRDQTITLTVGGTAAGEDFTIAGGDNRLLSAPYSLVFPAGASFVTATVRVVNDTDTEPTNETVTVSALLDLNSTSLGTRTVTIAPSDPAGAPFITGSPVAAGSPRVGEALVADTSAIALAGGQRPALFSYDWVADGDRGRVVTARNIYRVRPDDAGFTISVGVGIQADDGSVQLVRSATTSTIAAAVPASPGIVNATVGAAGSLHLTWEAPTWDVSSFQQGGSSVGDGGSPITGYTVQWKESTASWETAAAVPEATVTTTSHAITGLTAGTAYTVRVVATNNVGDSSPSLEVTVQDTVVNWGPGIVGSVWLEYAENGTGPVHTFLARDPESDTVTWSLAGDDSGAFSITGGVLRFAQTPDYEDPNHSSTFRVTVQAADATNRTAHPVAIVVTDVDEPPDISGVTTISDYDENGSGDVATFTASDPEGETNITWTLGGTDSGDFTITGGVLRFASAPDYERPAGSGGNNHYEITVQATDSTNKRGELHVDVIVQNVDEPPELTGLDTVDDFPENSAFSRQVGRYTATDPEGDTVTLSLTGADSDDFALASNGVLTFGESPDYEEQSRYIVTVRAVAGSHTVNKNVTVNIQNLEEPGAVSLSTVQPQEGTSLTATLEDDDVPAGTTWQWYRTSSRGSTGTAITGATSDNYTPEDPADVGYYLRAVAMYDDGHGDGKTAIAVSTNRVQEAPPGQEPPVFPDNSDYDRSVRENLPAGRNLGAPVTATDDDNDRLTYSIPASDYFEIVDSTGQLRTKAELDHETRPTHTVTVSANDPSNRSDRVSVTITVEDVDETPVVFGPNNSEVAENGNTSVATYTATDPDQEGIAWVLTGSDSAAFTLSGGVLTFNEVPDYEEKNQYRITIEVHEQSGGTSVGRLSVTVNIVNVDEPGMVEVPVSEPRVRQRLSATVSDQDGGVGSVEWKWERRPSGGDWIPIQGATSRTYTPAREDNGHDLRVTAIYRDGHGPGKTETYQFARPVELRPHFDSDTAERSVQENTPAGRNVGSRFTARHPDNANLTYSLAGAGRIYFDIDESNGQLKTSGVPLDYETLRDHQAEVEITATDTNRQTATITVNVAVTDVNEGPEISRVGSAPGSVPENQPQDTVLSRYTATDPENPAAQITRWSTSGTDGGDFVINEQGELRFRNTPDYERPVDSNRDNVYVFSVRAYDGRVYGYFDETVTVTAVNEPPTITTTSTSATTLRQPENRTSRLYIYRATDPEGAGTVSWSVAGVDEGFFTIDEQGQFSFSETSPPDYEQPGDSGGDNVYNVVVQATDDDNNTATLTVTITVTDLNEGPEVTRGGDSFDVQENRNWPGASFTALDPEQSYVTRWALGGRDGGDFMISETGVMTFRSVPDYERPVDSDRDNVYEVEVRPYDGRYYGSHNVVVTVEDVNEITGLATYNIAESFQGTLGSYSAVGRGDLTVEPKWSLSGTDGGDFTIDENGQMTFRSVPDYERPADSNRDNTYLFTVRATDDRYYGTLDVEVVVAAVNEPPTITTTSTSATSLSQPEKRTSRLYIYRATDPEGAGTVSWSVGGVDGRFFAIDERGQFSFSETSPPDYEQPGDSGGDNVYNVVVQATDDDNNTAPLDVTITVTDVNEGPEVTGPASLSIQENRYLTNAVYTATDPEGANVARWNVGGRDGGDFFITQGGTLYFRTLPDYERPADSNRDNTYEVLIQPSDSRNTGSYPVTVTVTDADEPPEIRSGSRTSFSQPENRASRLYSFSATDPEGSTVTWSVGGTDGSHFTIDERGQFSFDENDPPDFDSPGDQNGDNVYNATIQARDPQSNTASQPVTVVVTEVNEGPVIARQGNAPGSVRENIDQSTVLARYTASDPERPSVQITQWSTSGRDGGDFVINALGELRFRNSPDYERPADSNRDNVYELTIRASDGRYTGTLEEIQTVTVTDVNEPPTITTTSSTAFTQQENRTSTIYTFRATDPEGGSITWSPTGTDGSAFTIDERGALSFANPPDFDSPGDSGSDNVYNVRVEARDPEGNPDTLDVSVTVTDHNEGVEPTISTRRPPSTYRENGTSTVYTFRASDPQRAAITWTVTGTDSGAFTITPDNSGRGVLAFASPPDFEGPTDSNRDNVYELAVVATDEENYSDRVDFAITVTDHDEGVEPTISTRRPPSTYRENDTRTVYTFRASDPQRGTITWTVTGVDAGDFTIASDSSGRGVLTFNVPPDFENPVDSNRDNVYELAVVATDDDGHTDQVDFAIAVTNVDEGPQIRLDGNARTSVAENLEQDTVLAKYAATDPENPGAGIFRWGTSGRDGGDFVINELGELRFRSSPDFERPVDSNRDNVYELMVRAYDGRVYGTLEEPLLVTVTQVNEAPVITTRSRTAFSLRENSTSNIYTYQATDQDVSDAIRWSVEGPDAGDFAIYDGVLNFRLLPDFEIPADADEDNVYEITVVAADIAGLRDTVEAVITITDQSEGPVIAGPAFHTVAENYDIAQLLGSYTATDAKDGRAVYPQWSLSGRDGGDFVIDRYSGVLTFRNTPDYDRPADSNRDNIYEFTVRGHDSRAYGYLDVTVTVTPINEGAPVITGRTSHSVRENTATVIYTYRATDPDLNDSITWSTDGPDGHLFQVSDRGELSFGAGPDFETPRDTGQDNVYELEMVATDGQGLRGTLEVTVTVTEQNEGPVVSGTANFTVNENQDLPGATYTARDPEAVGGVTTTITWSTSGRDGGDFAIDRETGVLAFRTLPDHERPADSDRDNVYEFTVRAHDGRNYGYFYVTVTVEDVVEITGPATLGRPENFGGPLATYSAAGRGVLDVEPEWRLTGTDSGDFLIDRETGELTFRNLPDHERPADSNRDNVYNFAVQVSDGSYYETMDVTVTVTAVNEPPTVTGRDSMSFRENTPTTTRLYTYRATDPEGGAFTWVLGGPDASDFTIAADSSGRGVLTFASPPDFDSPAGSGTDANQYLVTIQARDDQGNTGELLVTVTVTDQNEVATVTGQNSIAVVENRDPAIVLASYSAVDPEGQAISRWSLSGSDGGDFLLSENGGLTFRSTPDYDRPADSNRDNEYLVTVRAYDGRTYGDLDVTITVSNVNEHAPVIRSGSRTTFTYREEGTSVLYTYSATDGDKDDAITWTTGGIDGRFFEFNDRNGLVFSEPPDYENPRDSGGNNEYELAVVATDAGGLNAGLAVTVTVTELNEGPEITGTTTYNIAENQDLVGATFAARDPEDPAAEVSRWSLAGSDAGDFTITDTGQNSAQLAFRDPPDYDRPADSNRDNEYVVTIRAYNGSTYGSLNVMVTVTDLNESDPVVSGRETLSFRENTATTTRLYTYTASDADRSAEIAWSLRGTDSDEFSITEDSSGRGELFFSSPPDHEQPVDSNSDNVYEIIAVASDGSNEGTLDVSTTVTDVNEGPEISGQGSRTVSENFSQVLASYTATDPEDPTAEITRWSMSGRDGGDFTVNEDGELSFRSPPDFERPVDSDRNNEYQFTVRASDGRVYGTFDVTVTVGDLNEAPEFRSGSRTSFSYRENGTSSLYTYRATDPEGSDVAWSLRGADASDFEISETGVLSFASPPDFDNPAGYGTDGNEYLLTVVATDDGTYGGEGQFTGAPLDGTLDVTVTVTDQNEGPTITDTGANTAFTVSENHEAVLSTYGATDPEDPGAEIKRWSTSGRDGGDFTINESGVLTFRNIPDFERPADSNRDNIYEMTVRASDGRYYGTLDVTVTVQAVDESPEFRSGSQDSFVYRENGTSAIYTYRATDPEGTGVSWGWSGTDSSAFTVSESGVLSFVSPPDYESPTDSGSDNSYKLIVEAGDEQSNTTRLEVTVTVTNLTDARASIQGTARVGRTLTADTSGIPGEDNQDGPAFSYQWMADDKDIEGATGSTYKVADDDEGKSLKVEVTFTDDEGNEETVTSAATDTVSGISNNAATGAPAITGTAQVGQTLTANTSGISDADGLDNVTFGHQWLADGANIEGAASSTYLLTGDDEGKTIRVRVTFTDDEGNEETVTSAATEEVAAKDNNAATGAPAITGTARVGQTLTANTSGISDADGLDNVTFGYQWLSDDADIEGATNSTYVLTGKDEGKTIRVRVTFTDDEGNEETVTSAATEEVAAKDNNAATGEPAITGTAQVGQTLTANTSGISDADGLDNVTFGYQWLSDDADIEGATNSTYVLTGKDEGKTIRVRVTFTDDEGNEETVTSAATEEVAAKDNNAATGEPAITGTTRVGQTLTANTPGISDADGLDNVTFGYQWLADGANIEGAASSTYLLTGDDEGKTIRVRVTFTDDEGNEETVTSAPTEEVAAKDNNAATGGPAITGTARVGQTLTADASGISDADGLDNVTFGYQWLSDDADIEGATNSTYVLTGKDEGKTIRVRVTFTDDEGNEETVTSVATEEVAAKDNNAATGEPAITGTTRVGQTLTANTSGISDADGLDNVTFGYQWLSDDADIEGATNSTYVLTGDDEGKTIRVRVTFTDDEGNEETVTSAATEEVAAKDNNAATGEPAITGTTRVGQTLTANTSGISDADGLDNVTFGYQWLSDDADIEGATNSTYVLTGKDEGKTIRVRVTFTDDEGNEETVTSAPTEPVAPRPPLTASFLSTPSIHDGAEFTFELRFSEELPLSYVTLRDHVFTVEGGTVEKARRLDRPSNLRWEITVQPASTDDVAVVLPATTECNAQGAICTEDGRMLSGSLEMTVSGPGG